MAVKNVTHIGRVELKKSIIIDIGYGGPPMAGCTGLQSIQSRGPQYI